MTKTTAAAPTPTIDGKKSMRDAALPDVKIKKRHVVFGILGSIVAFFVWWFTVPYTAPPEYGVCKTFMEMHVKYPRTLKVSAIDFFDQSLRIYYTYIEPYGNIRSNMIECVFRPDSQNGYVLERLLINRKPVLTPQGLEAYNAVIPAILASKPDLRAPLTYDLERSLYELKAE